MKKQGFTLVEIMIVVLIIGLLAAIAIPNFLKARTTTQKNACIDNLRAIQGACEQAKMEGLTPASANLFGGTCYIKKAPTCPTGKDSYAIPTGDDDPVCPGTVDGHVLAAGT
jgi:prepilin-type N-terminal cleavage/methylation domain-containing protein